MGVFSPNPLSLSVSDAAFDSWLRDKGYLEVLDRATTNSNNNDINDDISKKKKKKKSLSSPSESPDDGDSGGGGGWLWAVLGPWMWVVNMVVSLLTMNPFAKLTAEDFGGETPAWTENGFFGRPTSYSIPSDSSQMRMRVHENVKRYARSYSLLFLFFFACSLYQMPLALLGLIAGLALWEAFRFCSNRWVLERYSFVSQALLRLIQFATVVILFSCNVQITLVCAISISYAVMLLHASLRKLTPAKQSDRGHRRFLTNKFRI